MDKVDKSKLLIGNFPCKCPWCKGQVMAQAIFNTDIVKPEVVQKGLLGMKLEFMHNAQMGSKPGTASTGVEK